MGDDEIFWLNLSSDGMEMHISRSSCVGFGGVLNPVGIRDILVPSSDIFRRTLGFFLFRSGGVGAGLRNNRARISL